LRFIEIASHLQFTDPLLAIDSSTFFPYLTLYQNRPVLKAETPAWNFPKPSACIRHKPRLPEKKRTQRKNRGIFLPSPPITSFCPLSQATCSPQVPISLPQPFGDLFMEIFENRQFP